jgi:hypothetical protein
MRHGVSGKKARPSLADEASKKPSMSRITSVVLVAYTLTAKSAPAGTMAALALMRPSSEFKVEMVGRVCPDGHTVR